MELQTLFRRESAADHSYKNQMYNIVFYFPERINSCVPKPEPEFMTFKKFIGSLNIYKLGLSNKIWRVRIPIRSALSV